MESEESETWTKENLQRLLATLKANIPETDSCATYVKTQKKINWNKVAFPPFSPAECEKKWTQILQKMRKFRSLMDLITEAEDAISIPGHNTKIHPELPKKPTPPNALYFEENHSKFQKQHPEMSYTSIIKYSTDMFKRLSDQERAPYVEKFNLALKEYNNKMEEFRRQYGKLSNRHLKKYQKRRISGGLPEEGADADCLPSMPPRNSYNLFCREQKCLSKDGCMAQWAQRWAELDESERQLYAARCKELKEEYGRKLRDYLQRMDKNEQKEVLHTKPFKVLQNSKVKSTKKNNVSIPGEPRMPPRSGNITFNLIQMKHLKQKFPNSKQCLAEATKMWMNLSEEEKEHYIEMTIKNKTKYWIDLQKWFDTLTPTQQEDYLKLNPKKREHLIQKFSSEREEIHHLPSDSEDDDIEDSSSDEEENFMEWNEDEDEEEEEEEDDNVFVID